MKNPLGAESTQGNEQSSPSRREWMGVAGVFAIALLLRCLHLREIHANDPFFELPAVDPLLYHRWAIEIAGGNWLGEGVFLQGPLYPYLLALLYKITGPSFVAPRLIQALLGAISCVLVWALAREFFDRRTSLLAAGLSAAYSMFIFYGGSLLIVNLQIPLNLLMLLALTRALSAPTVSRWLLTGIWLGLSCLARPNLLLYVPVALVFLIATFRGRIDSKRQVIFALSFCIGVTLFVGASTLRNYWVTGDPVLVSASAGMNFFNGNNAGADGTHRTPRIFSRTQADGPLEQNQIYREVAEKNLGHALSASEVSRYWFGHGLRYISSNPMDWVRLELRKFALFVNATELWNVRSIEVSRQFSWVLRAPLISLAVVAPFALLGMGLTAQRWRRLAPIHAFLGVYLVTALVFFVLSRYRTPIVPVLLIFAAHAMIWLFDVVRKKQWVPLAVAILLLALGATATNWNLVRLNQSMAYYNLGNKYLSLKQYDLAIDQFKKSLRIDSSYISAFNNLAISLEQRGGMEKEAIEIWGHVLATAKDRKIPRYIEISQRHLAALGAAPTLDESSAKEGGSD